MGRPHSQKVVLRRVGSDRISQEELVNPLNKERRLNILAQPHQAILHGAAKQIRPKSMKVATTFLGLVPIMWAVGTGST